MSLAICEWFLFWLLNYAAITSGAAGWLKRVLGPKLGYPLSCSGCFPFWTTLALWLITDLPLYAVPVTTVIHLFIDLAYHKLSGPSEGGDV